MFALVDVVRQSSVVERICRAHYSIARWKIFNLSATDQEAVNQLPQSDVLAVEDVASSVGRTVTSIGQHAIPHDNGEMRPSTFDIASRRDIEKAAYIFSSEE